MFKTIRGWFRQAEATAEEAARGGRAVATPPPGAATARLGDADRETSTNAQVEGAVGQPWSGSR
jgi:hypothetical protein